MKLETYKKLATLYTQYAAARGVEVQLTPVNKGVEFRTLAGSLIWTLENVVGCDKFEFAASVERELNEMADRQATERFEQIRNCKSGNCVESQNYHVNYCVYFVESNSPAEPARVNCWFCGSSVDRDDLNLSASSDGLYFHCGCDAFRAGVDISEAIDWKSVNEGDARRAAIADRIGSKSLALAEQIRGTGPTLRPIKSERSIRLEVVALDNRGATIQRDPIGTPADYAEGKRIVARAFEHYGPGIRLEIRRVITSIETLSIHDPSSDIAPEQALTAASGPLPMPGAGPDSAFCEYCLCGGRTHRSNCPKVLAEGRPIVGTPAPDHRITSGAAVVEFRAIGAAELERGEMPGDLNEPWDLDAH